LRFKIYTLLLAIISSNIILAGGFQINEHGAKAMALGGAYTAIANDASAIYWNGAGMTQLSGTNFLLGTALIAPRSSFRGVAPAVDQFDMKSAVFFPSHLFITHSFTPDLSAGIGITTPFGLGTEWEEDWIGKYLAIETELKTFWIPLTVAYNVFEDLSVSAGFVYSFADVLITRKNSQQPFEGDAFIHLEGSESSAFGYTFGIMYKPINQLSIGAAFRSQVHYTFEGTAEATGAQQLLEEKIIPQGDVTADLKTPVNIVGGIAYQVIPQLRLSADFQWIGWSSYDSLKVDFADPDYDDLASPRLYNDTYNIRFGVEYKAWKDISLLGGIYFDKMPVDQKYVNPSLPDSDRLGFSIGADVKLMENIGVTGSYLFIRAAELTVDDSEEIYTPGNSPFNGIYNSYANVFSLSIYYNIQ
jgi:long-chain fatty acid transport protein